MDISLKITAEKLGKSLENLSEQVEEELNDAVKNVASSAYATAIAKAQNMRMGDASRQDYIKGLSLTDMGDNSYLISLEGDWANQLEEGISPYNMKEKLLASKKRVSVGSRAGEPWVQTSKQGNRFAHVPFEHKPFAKNPLTGKLESDILKMTAKNRQGKVQKLTEIFKDDFGKPIVGKVARIESDNANLNNLVKYQHVYPSGTVQSIYMTFRTISDSSGGWQHKGTKGLHIFKELEEYVQAELENIVKIIL